MSAPRYEIKTRYDEAAYAALVHLMMKKLRRWPRLVILASGFVSVAGSAAVMFTQGVSLTGAIFLIAGNLMCMFGLFAPRIAVRMMIASNKKGEAPVNVYVFSDEGMCVRSSETEKEYSYGFIRRILEMSGYLFFFMQDGQTYLLRAADAANYAAFREYLNERVLAARAAGRREE